MTVHTIVDSPLGALTLVAVPATDPQPENRPESWLLAGLYYPDHVPTPHRERFGENVPPDDPSVDALVQAVAAYLDGGRTSVDVPLADPVGTPFQRAVWARVAEIPYASTLTYADVAAGVGHPTAHRAVGTALAANPVCLAVPCHRVVAAGGRITGYAGGVDRKAWLLAHERMSARTATGLGPDGDPRPLER